jgi:hypothetical protein
MVVHDRDREKTKDLAALGAVVAPNAEALAEDVDVVLSCLPNDAAVQDVYLGTNTLLESARPSTCIVELSTTSEPSHIFQAETLLDHYSRRCLPGHQIREPNITDFSLAHKIVQGSQRLLQGRVAIPSVHLVEVNIAVCSRRRLASTSRMMFTRVALLRLKFSPMGSRTLVARMISSLIPLKALPNSVSLSPRL